MYFDVLGYHKPRLSPIQLFSCTVPSHTGTLVRNCVPSLQFHCYFCKLPPHHITDLSHKPSRSGIYWRQSYSHKHKVLPDHNVSFNFTFWTVAPNSVDKEAPQNWAALHNCIACKVQAWIEVFYFLNQHLYSHEERSRIPNNILE